MAMYGLSYFSLYLHACSKKSAKANAMFSGSGKKHLHFKKPKFLSPFSDETQAPP
jgi:hypothetical protein